MKKYMLVPLCILLIIGWFWTEGYGWGNNRGVGNTVYEAVLSAHQDSGEVFQVGRVIEEIEIEDGKRLAFYLNNENGLLVALVQQKWNGKWEHQGTSGTESIEARFDGQIISEHYSYIATDIPLWWGVVYDADVKQILVDDKEANLVERDGVRIWYLITPGEKSGIANIVTFD